MTIDISKLLTAESDPASLEAQARIKRGLGYEAKAPSGQMIGDVYVPAHPMQMLSEALRGYTANQDVKSGIQSLQDIQGQRQAREARDMSKYIELLRGTPGTPENAPSPDLNGNAVGPTRPAQQGTAANPQLAEALALSNGNPMLKQLALSRIEKEPELQAKAQENALNRQSREDMARLTASLHQQNQTPFFQAIPTANGYQTFNARTGQMQPVVGANGQPVIGAQYDPTLQGNLANAKAAAATTGKANATAALNLPDTLAQGNQTIRLIDELVKHPGLSGAVGAGRMTGAYKIPGTDAANAVARMDQIKGQQFLQAYNSLKGAGQITEIEGTKAENAVARMQASQSQEEFTKAAKEFQGIIRQGMERAQGRAGQAPTGNIDSLLDKYK
jgi:hypothetical protein